MQRALILIPERHPSFGSPCSIEHVFYWYALWSGLEKAGVSVTAAPVLLTTENRADEALLKSLQATLMQSSFDAVFAPATPATVELLTTINSPHRIAVTTSPALESKPSSHSVFSHYLDLTGQDVTSSPTHLFTYPCIPDELLSLRRVCADDFSTAVATNAQVNHRDEHFEVRLAQVCSHLAEQASNPTLCAFETLAAELRTIRLEWIQHRVSQSASPHGLVVAPSASCATRFLALLEGNPVVDSVDAIHSSEEAMSLWLRARNEALFKHTALIRGWDIIRWIDDGAIQHEDYRGQYIPNPEDSLFYSSFFNKGCELNTDEQSRLNEIQKCYSILINRVRATVKTLDVGCGRGWLTEFATHFGEATGIEPIPEVINHARTLFPKNNYLVSTPELALRTGQAGRYDVCLCSEVIEHVPNEYKRNFIGHLRALLKPNGYLVLTTPRGERYDEWMSKYGGNSQPVEDWISEDDMRTLAEECGFVALYKGRAGYISDIYQVWLFHYPGDQL